MGLFPALILGEASTVVLRHELADGSFHFDWLLEWRRGPDRDARDLLSFRAGSDPFTWTSGRSVELERTPDHRRHYLRFEGPIDAGRGWVRRVAEGTFEVVEANEGECLVRVTWRVPAAQLRRYSLAGLESSWESGPGSHPDSAQRSASSNPRFLARCLGGD